MAPRERDRSQRPGSLKTVGQLGSSRSYTRAAHSKAGESSGGRRAHIRVARYLYGGAGFIFSTSPPCDTTLRGSIRRSELRLQCLLEFQTMFGL